MKVLVISAHPDDEVIGAGGTIARHVDHGDEVYWCIVTQAYTPPWSKEYLERARQQVYEVQKVLGIQEVFFCGFPTVKLNTIPYMEISSALQGIVDQVQPEVVYTTPGNDINLDHRIVYECTLVATRPLPGNSIQRLLSYEIGDGPRQGLMSGNGGFVPNVFVDVSQYMEKKLEAMSCYESELKEYPHPRSLKGVRMVAEARGLGVGLTAAEAFRLVRQVI